MVGISNIQKNKSYYQKRKIGIATGLAWTEVGGDVLEIETTVLPGKGGLDLDRTTWRCYARICACRFELYSITSNN